MLKVRLKLRNVIAIAICLAGITMFVSCDKENSVIDPEGTITANISAETRVSFDDWSLLWSSPNNFVTGSDYATSGGIFMGYAVQVSFYDVGKIKGLGNIKTIPESGFSRPVSARDNSIACEKGRGYIIKVESRRYEDDIYFVRLFVEDYIIGVSGGVIGVKIKYQYPFWGQFEQYVE